MKRNGQRDAHLQLLQLERQVGCKSFGLIGINLRTVMCHREGDYTRKSNARMHLELPNFLLVCELCCVAFALDGNDFRAVVLLHLLQRAL